MPVVTIKPDQPGIIEQNLPVVEPPAYKSVVMSDALQPLSSLISLVEGSAYTVNYYSQVLSIHNDLREQDVGQNPLYQQYSKIVGLEIKVTTPLASAQDPATGVTTVTGSANLYPPLVPNPGDMFIGSIGDGSDGIFTITAVERKNFSRDSVYSIDYTLVSDIAQNSLRFNDLEGKVTKTVYFRRDSLLTDKNPNMIEADWNNLQSLTTGLLALNKLYVQTFFNREYMTLTIPGQSTDTYDKFVVDIIKAFVPTTDVHELRLMRVLNTDGDEYLDQPTLYTAVTERDMDILGIANVKMSTANTNVFSNLPVLDSIRYSGLGAIVYPSDPDISTSINRVPPKLLSQSAGIVEIPTRSGQLNVLVRNNFLPDNPNVPIINPVLTDDYYVLSAAFYNQTAGMSVLETLVSDHIKRNAVNATTFINVMNQFKYWGRLEQFYYGPLLIAIANGLVADI